jgi:hypothetical protein
MVKGTRAKQALQGQLSLQSACELAARQVEEKAWSMQMQHDTKRQAKKAEASGGEGQDK